MARISYAAMASALARGMRRLAPTPVIPVAIWSSVSAIREGHRLVVPRDPRDDRRAKLIVATARARCPRTLIVGCSSGGHQAVSEARYPRLDGIVAGDPA
jgi:hypothetical protein